MRNQDPPSSQTDGTKARLSTRSVEMGMRKVESLDFGYGIVDGSVDYLPDKIKYRLRVAEVFGLRPSGHHRYC